MKKNKAVELKQNSQRMRFSIRGKNMLNIERLAVEDYLGLEKEEIGALSSQLNKALLG